MTGLAPGEHLYAARFLGKRAYLVTFQQVDPFFVVDLSDPTSPKVLGDLNIPGFSDYLQPYDENHIIGIGKDTTPNPQENGMARPTGLKIALFDVTNPAAADRALPVRIPERQRFPGSLRPQGPPVQPVEKPAGAAGVFTQQCRTIL